MAVALYRDEKSQMLFLDDIQQFQVRKHVIILISNFFWYQGKGPTNTTAVEHRTIIPSRL